MCGRIVQVSKVSVVEKKFNVLAKHPELIEPSYNIGAGQDAMVITSEAPNQLQLFQFGFSPSWAKKQMYLLNARAEGDNNKEDDVHYSGGMGIIHKPAFQQAIRQQRCLVLADCFYEGPKEERLSKPYVVYVRNRRPFAFAGIYNQWLNPNDGIVINTFAIVTTWANELMQKIGHHRSPVILEEHQHKAWLHADHLTNITSLLHPYPSEKMNAYPVSSAVKLLKNNSVDLVQPIGQRILPEFDMNIQKTWKVEGMGNTKRE